MRKKITPTLAVAVLLAGSAATASAAVISFIDQDIPIPTTYAGVSVNLETASSSTALAGEIGADMNFALGGEGISNDADQFGTAPTWQPVRAGTGNSDVIQNLGIDTIVGPTSVVSSGYGGSIDQFPAFTSGTRGYVGFSVVLADTTVAYGWAEVTLQDDNTPGVIHSWAYEDTGASLRVSAVPEPTQVILIAFGLLVPAFRRRR